VAPHAVLGGAGYSVAARRNTSRHLDIPVCIPWAGTGTFCCADMPRLQYTHKRTCRTHLPSRCAAEYNALTRARRILVDVIHIVWFFLTSSSRATACVLPMT